MKLEQQVTSLEISKRLKELGVKQESLVHWSEWNRSVEVGGTRHEMKLFYAPEIKIRGCDFSAFTVAELGEMLPEATMSYRPYNMQEPEFFCERHHKSASVRDLSFHAPTEADARGKMLIYLLENKLLIL